MKIIIIIHFYGIFCYLKIISELLKWFIAYDAPIFTFSFIMRYYNIIYSRLIYCTSTNIERRKDSITIV